MSSWTMEAIINMHSMSNVYEKLYMNHRVCIEHCIVILPKDNPVGFSIETDHCASISVAYSKYPIAPRKYRAI